MDGVEAVREEGEGYTTKDRIASVRPRRQKAEKVGGQ